MYSYKRYCSVTRGSVWFQKVVYSFRRHYLVICGIGYSWKPSSFNSISMSFQSATKIFINFNWFGRGWKIYVTTKRNTADKIYKSTEQFWQILQQVSHKFPQDYWMTDGQFQLILYYNFKVSEVVCSLMGDWRGPSATGKSFLQRPGPVIKK